MIDITLANHDVFKADNPGMPKVLLFTESKKAPIIFRALSTYFDVSNLEVHTNAQFTLENS